MPGQTLRHYDPTQLWFQLREIAEQRCYLQHGVEVEPGDVVLDVGANVGVAAEFFAVECKAGAVHCFEPVAPICELLRQNVAELQACVVHEYGLSSAPGRASITYYPGAAAMSGLYADPERDRELVRTSLFNHGFTDTEAEEQLAGRYEPQLLDCELRTLSSVLRDERIERVNLLKIDVERAELDVLEGIDEDDWPRIRQLAMEVHDQDGRLDRIAASLRERGFEVAAEQEPVMRGTDVQMLWARRQ